MNEHLQVTRESGYALAFIEDNREIVPLVGLGDFHIGVKTFNEPLLRETVRIIKDLNAYWVGMGDWLEAAQKNSIGAGVYEQIMDLTEQRKLATDLVAPISGTCLGLIKGNHEERLMKNSGIDMMMIMAEQLEVPYFGWEFYGAILRKPYPARSDAFRVYASHTRAGNKTTGLALNWMERDLKTWVDADIYLKAHDHSQGCIPVMDYSLVVNHGLHLVQRTKYLVTTGHFMHRADTYVAASAMRPKVPGTLLLEMRVTGPAHRKMVVAKELPDGV